MSNKGKKVQAHYRGTLDDGTVFDTSYGGEPLMFTAGAGQMIPGFDAAVVEMEVGEKRTVHIEPKDAYGEYRDDLVIEFPKAKLPHPDKVEVGDKLLMGTTTGQPIQVRVIAIGDDSVTLDANHELAGKALNFEIELVKVVG